jgi:hypothetical protein
MAVSEHNHSVHRRAKPIPRGFKSKEDQKQRRSKAKKIKSKED